MDIDELIRIFNCARNSLIEIAKHYIGSPYTDVVVNSLICDCDKALEMYNQVLRDNLCIELYSVISPIITESSVSCRLFVRPCWKMGGNRKEIGEKRDEIPQYN